METPVVASNTPSGTGTTCPSTMVLHQEDDILIAHFGWRGNQAPQVLTGWNVWFSQSTGTATNGCGQGLWWRRVAPSETVSAPTLTIGTTAVERKCHMIRIRGADIDNPANMFWLKQQSLGNSAAPTPAGITLAAPGYQLLHFVTCRGNSSVTQPTGYTELADAAEGTTLCVEVSYKDQATAGVISGQAASISSNRWVSAIVAVPSPDYCYFRAQTSTTANGTSVTGTLPTGTTQTDLYGRADGMLAIVKAAGSGVTITPTDAAWANVASWDLDTSSGSDSIEVFAAEFATGRNLQFPRSGSGNIAVQLLTYRNVHQTAFIGNSSARQNSGSPAPWDATTRGSTKSTMIGVIVCDADTNNVNTAPSGYMERSDGLGIATCDQVFESGGSTASANWTTTNAANVTGMIELLSHAGVAAAATLERSAAVSATADISSAGQAFSVFERSTAVSASASVAVSGESFSVLSGNAALSATGEIAATGMTERLRSASLSATADVSVSGVRVVERSSSFTAAAAIETSGEAFTIFESAASLTVTAGIESSGLSFSVIESAVDMSASAALEVAGVRIVERSLSLAATAAIESSGIFFSVITGTVQVDATAEIQSSAEFFSVFECQVEMAATAAISIAHQTEQFRSASLSAVADIAVSGGIEGGIFEHERSAAFTASGVIESAAISFSVIEAASMFTATAEIATASQRELHRSVAVSAVAGLEVAGYSGAEPIERSAAISATATISVSATFQHPTPPRRTFVVELEQRRITMPVDRRVYVVPAEDREEVVI